MALFKVLVNILLDSDIVFSDKVVSMLSDCKILAVVGIKLVFKMAFVTLYDVPMFTKDAR
jgi:hypothetical protein